jgi:hypothetical protein
MKREDGEVVRGLATGASQAHGCAPLDGRRSCRMARDGPDKRIAPVHSRRDISWPPRCRPRRGAPGTARRNVLGRQPENCATTNMRVSDAPSIPVWLVALALAAFAPLCARAVQLAFEQRLRRRTLDTLSRAWPPTAGGIAAAEQASASSCKPNRGRET